MYTSSFPGGRDLAMSPCSLHLSHARMLARGTCPCNMPAKSDRLCAHVMCTVSVPGHLARVMYTFKLAAAVPGPVTDYWLWPLVAGCDGFVAVYTATNPS